eukprot:TRINITY_DN12065_c0_g1_i1.p1 TRINITY_DN12065_c0_g1~~TRINITY_DN12065_c0_g1_i1.p1  ORF type:complete len:675 (+),score=54.08 TRINITY_DN12065_c0_g1_i1:71-2095(+)
MPSGGELTQQSRWQYMDRSRLPEWQEHYMDHVLLRRQLVEHGVADEARSTAWRQTLTEECKRVDSHYLNIASALEEQVQDVRQRGQVAVSEQILSNQAHLEIDLSAMYNRVLQLKDFVNHNVSNCRQLLLSEFIRHGGASEQAFALAESFKQGCGFYGNTTRLDRLAEHVLELSELFHVDIIRYSSISGVVSSRLYFWQVFLLGVGCTSILTTFSLYVNVAHQDVAGDDDLDMVLDALPVFRCCGIFGFVLFVSGAVLRVLEGYRINYLMILEIDPAIRIESKKLFTVGQMQLVWVILVFQAYVMDYKWGILFGTQKAWALFPLMVAIPSFVVWLLPIFFCPWGARWHVLRCLFDVVFAICPCVPKVTFSANLLANVLTSCTKPLKDLAYTFCYTGKVLSRIGTLDSLGPHGIGDQCSAFFQGNFLSWLFLSLPYVFRCLQCIRRYFEKRDYNHLVNAGKYSVSWIVSFVAFLDLETSSFSEWDENLVMFILYTFSSAYSLTWDIARDFGLLPDFPRCSTFHRNARLYPRWVYPTVTVADALCRTTWCTTLFSDAYLSKYFGLHSEMFKLGAEVIEVFRRGLWCILRIENEAATNAGKYREFVWLPPLPTTPSFHRQTTTATQGAARMASNTLPTSALLLDDSEESQLQRLPSLPALETSTAMVQESQTRASSH